MLLVMNVVMMDIKVLWMECLQTYHVTLSVDIVTRAIHREKKLMVLTTGFTTVHVTQGTEPVKMGNCASKEVS